MSGEHVHPELASGSSVTELQSKVIELEERIATLEDAGPEEPPPPPDDEEPPPPPDDEEPPPPVAGEVVGYGRIVVPGTQELSIGPSLSELKAAVSQPDRLVKLPAGFIDLGGQALSPAQKVTIEGRGEASQVGNGWVRKGAGDLTLRNFMLWGGDETTVDADTFNANGQGRFVLDHMLILWGVDVTMAILNGCEDFTVQYSVIAEGLYLSKHPEANTAEGGHSMGFNCTDIGAGVAPKRGTFYRDAFINSADRNGRFMGPEQIDLIECLLYGWQKTQGFHGAPKSLNVVNNVVRIGPKGSAVAAFQPSTSGDVPQITPDAVYVDGNVADGFTFKSVSSPAFRSSPKHPLSVESLSTPDWEAILRTAGPMPWGKQMQRLLADVQDRRTVYVNGKGKGGLEYPHLLAL
jgi:hypothetical protein